MFRQALFNSDVLRRRRGQVERKCEEDDCNGVTTDEAKESTSSSPKACPGRSLTSRSAGETKRDLDVFDTHVGPFLEKYVLCCQKKGVLRGWIPGLLGLVFFMLVSIVVGGGVGNLTGQGIIVALDKCGVLEKLKQAIASLEKR